MCASNPLCTQDEAAASLVKHDQISVFAIKGENHKTYYAHINAVLDTRPQYSMDDGADLVSTLHSERQALLRSVRGGTEETTTGVIRLAQHGGGRGAAVSHHRRERRPHQALFRQPLRYRPEHAGRLHPGYQPLIAGTNFVVCGYGWCGRGIAMRARGMGANVVVTEIDPLPALEAVMDGFRVMPIGEAAKIGDFLCTVTGNINVIRKEHFRLMKDGAIVANSGHFNVELDLSGWEVLPGPAAAFGPSSKSMSSRTDAGSTCSATVA